MEEKMKCEVCGRDMEDSWWMCTSCGVWVCEECCEREVEKPVGESFIIPHRRGLHEYTGDICAACWALEKKQFRTPEGVRDCGLCKGQVDGWHWKCEECATVVCESCALVEARKGDDDTFIIPWSWGVYLAGDCCRRCWEQYDCSFRRK